MAKEIAGLLDSPSGPRARAMGPTAGAGMSCLRAALTALVMTEEDGAWGCSSRWRLPAGNRGRGDDGDGLAHRHREPLSLLMWVWVKHTVYR